MISRLLRSLNENIDDYEVIEYNPMNEDEISRAQRRQKELSDPEFVANRQAKATKAAAKTSKENRVKAIGPDGKKAEFRKSDCVNIGSKGKPKYAHRDSQVGFNHKIGQKYDLDPTDLQSKNLRQAVRERKKSAGKSKGYPSHKVRNPYHDRLGKFTDAQHAGK